MLVRQRLAINWKMEIDDKLGDGMASTAYLYSMRTRSETVWHGLQNIHQILTPRAKK